MSVSSRRTNRLILITAAALVLAIFVGAQFSKAPAASGALAGKTAVVYRAATCGCCGNYIAYLRGKGVKVEEKITADMDAVKRRLGVPSGLSSCHTMEIDGYVVEGHIPVEGVEKLLTERPALAGIALPDMPSGSPGMPGSKYGPFAIAGFTASGSSSPYVSL